MFDDEFTGPAGSAPNPALWSYDVGGGGWGNNEKQIYTDSRMNSYLDGAGHLAISAVNHGFAFTSARMNTSGKFAFTFGRAAARIKFPAGQGLHSAFWLLGTDVNSVGWPQSGEIDTVETLNNEQSAHVAIHGPQGNAGYDVSTVVPLDRPDGNFHTYWVQRSPGLIQFGIDGLTVRTIRKSSLAPGQQWVFDKPFYLILNIAVGGDWPGPASPGTPFPATMLVDWVRVTGE